MEPHTYGITDTKFCIQNTMEDRFRRLKVVLSRTIYDEHVESIRRANTEIRDIVHQNLRLEDPRRRRKLPKAVIHHYSRARRHARSLHKVLMGSGCWQCNAQCRHVANIRLECKDSTLSSGTQSSEATRINVLLALSTKCAPPEASDAFQWKELAIEPVQEVTSTQRLNSAATSITSLSTKVNESTSKAGDPFQLFGKVSREKGKKSVSFALSATGTSTAIGAALGSFNDKEPSPISKPPSMIHDLCSMLREISTCPRAHECIGILTDGIQQSMQHQLFLLNSDRKVTETCSLESLLRTKQIKLSRGDRLRIASRLASSILQFEGSWFKDTWRSCDILFMKDEVETRDSLINRTPYSYLSWSVSKGDPTNLPNIDSHLGVDNSDEHLIRSKPLLYLGIALIELAFGNTLEELCIERNISFSSQPPAKTDAMTVLSIATKLLNDVSGESGPRYGDVVRRCLQCPYDIRDTSLDNDEFQQAILETVVTPLVDDLKVFEGASRIR